jgi:predicted metal-dependent hydrolase
MELNYQLVRSKRRKKTIALYLRKDGSIVVQAPYGVPIGEIDHFFCRKKDWLQKKIEDWEEKSGENRSKEFLPGETFLYLGVSYPLFFSNNHNGHPFAFDGSQFILCRENMDQARTLFTGWYRQKAREYIEEKVCRYSELLDLYPRRIRIGNARSRWGACSSNNHVSFTWRLIMAPGPVIDYVIIHELFHIKEKNHSNRFWNLLERFMPDYGIHRLWLRKNGHLLDV